MDDYRNVCSAKDAIDKRLEECFHRFSHMVDEGAGPEGEQYAMLYQVSVLFYL